jgi:hypothetical protein
VNLLLPTELKHLLLLFLLPLLEQLDLVSYGGPAVILHRMELATKW